MDDCISASLLKYNSFIKFLVFIKKYSILLQELKAKGISEYNLTYYEMLEKLLFCVIDKNKPNSYNEKHLYLLILILLKLLFFL